MMTGANRSEIFYLMKIDFGIDTIIEEDAENRDGQTMMIHMLTFINIPK